MKENNAGLKSNLSQVDLHKISQSEYDDIPELPDTFFTQGQLYRDGKPIDRSKRDHPKKRIKSRVTIKLNHEVADFFRSRSHEWQDEINDVLKRYIDKHYADASTAANFSKQRPVT
jgi:uncharacterized protein (DUF4415 family)